MKRAKRLLALLLAVVLGITLTGCDVVDDMRRVHAVRLTDDSILWNDSVPKIESPHMQDIYLEADVEKEKNRYGYYEEITVFVTEPDVPVLLSDVLGDWFDSCEDGVFLQGDYLYCREDKFDEMQARFGEGYRLEQMTYTYQDLDEEGVPTTKEYTLTEAEMAAVQQVYSTVLPTVLEDGMYFSCDYSTELYGNTSDGLFQRYLFNLEVAGDAFYLTDKTNMYRVPSDYNEIFSGILRPLLEGEKRVYERWAGEYSF